MNPLVKSNQLPHLPDTVTDGQSESKSRAKTQTTYWMACSTRTHSPGGSINKPEAKKVSSNVDKHNSSQNYVEIPHFSTLLV